MPTGPNVGYASLTVVPSFRGFTGELNKGLAGEMPKAGERAGTQLRRGIEEKLGHVDLPTKHFVDEGEQVGAKLGKGMADEVERHLAKVNVEKARGASGGLSGLGLGFGFGAAALGIKEVFDASSDLNEAASKTRVVFGDAAVGVLAFSDTAAKNIGLSKVAALDALGTFGNLFRAMGIGVGTSADMSQSLVTLAGDLASFNNANPEDVLVALKSGLVGETEPLRQFGVNLNEARIKAEALRLGLVHGNVNLADVQTATLGVEKAQKAVAVATKEHGANSLEARDANAKLAQAQQTLEEKLAGSNVELDAAQKAQAAYSLIVQDTTLAQGDFARTADGAANSQRILSAEFEDLKAKVGEQFTPAGTTLLSWISTGLSWISGWWTEHAPQIDAGLDRLRAKFTETFGEDPIANFRKGLDTLFGAESDDPFTAAADRLAGVEHRGLIGDFIDKLKELWHEFEVGSALVYDKIGPAWEWLGDKVLWVKNHVFDPVLGTVQDIFKKLGEIENDPLFRLIGTIFPSLGGIAEVSSGVSGNGPPAPPDLAPVASSLVGAGLSGSGNAVLEGASRLRTPAGFAGQRSGVVVNQYGVDLRDPEATAVAARRGLRSASMHAGGA